MTGIKEIRTQIKSIGSTCKITKAMEMVAASKMRGAQKRMQASRPYAKKIRNVINHLAHAHAEYKHPYSISRKIKSVGLIIVSSDRGLCGGLNLNLFRDAINLIYKYDNQGIKIKVAVIGNKASSFFKRLNVKVISETTNLGDVPRLKHLIGLIKVMMDAYRKEEIDQLLVFSNKFVNTMSQKPIMEQLIPIQAIQKPEKKEKIQHYWDYIYELEAKDIIDVLMSRYIESLIYQLVAENSACEQAARMVSMRSATDNANKLIEELHLIYNKARQSAITQELSEIVCGADAV